MMYIRLKTIENVKEFINITEKYEEEILVSNYKYIVNGKSILGVLSLNITDELHVTINTQESEVRREFYEKISKWRVE